MATAKMKPFRCPMCDEGLVQEAKVAYTVMFRRKAYVISDADVMACDRCGEVFFARGQSDALQRQASDLARAEMGLVTGAQIAAFRRRHGLTQAALERLLGAPPKSVARWEVGSVLQSRTVDTFLRVLMSHPDLLAELPITLGEGVARAQPERG